MSIHGKKATVSIDYAGESLHRRGYRVPGENVEASLKEALAAGMLVWGGWDRVAAPPYVAPKRNVPELMGLVEAPVFVDPACGQRNAGSGSSHDGSRSRPGSFPRLLGF